MKEYTIIGNFKYNNNIYELLIDEDNRYFFLRNNNKEEYITLEELLELSNLFSEEEHILNFDDNKKRPNKKRIVPKIIIGSLLVSLSIPMITSISKLSANTISKAKATITQQKEESQGKNLVDKISHTEQKEEELSKTEKAVIEALKSIEQEEERFELITKKDLVNNNTIIYDSSEFDEIFGVKKEEITYDNIREDIKNNPNIPDKFKDLYITLANNLEKIYPTLDLRVWHYNLQALEIKEVSEIDMKFKAMSVSASACYRKDENAIYTVEGYNYKPGTWDYQIIMHEMCHPIRGGTFKKDNKIIRASFSTSSGHGQLIEEALNSIFTVRSYDNNERDIAYQLQSNMIEIILDSMDDYTLQDYIEHDVRYFENKLNEQNENNDAVRILGLIELQYKDYHNEKIKIDQTQFHEVYDYIAKMYYKKNIKQDMSYEQAKEIYKTFLDRLTFDVPNEYDLDINHINDYFEQYIKEIGIKANKTL